MGERQHRNGGACAPSETRGVLVQRYWAVLRLRPVGGPCATPARSASDRAARSSARALCSSLADRDLWRAGDCSPTVAPAASIRSPVRRLLRRVAVAQFCPDADRARHLTMTAHGFQVRPAAFIVRHDALAEPASQSVDEALRSLQSKHVERAVRHVERRTAVAEMESYLGRAGINVSRAR